jgi:hypothetical protein
MKDIICPKCGGRHGPAAKVCDCGYSFEVAEEPAPARYYFLAALFFAAVTGVSAFVAQKQNAVYLPLGGLLFTSVTFTLGVRSWLYSFGKDKKP